MGFFFFVYFISFLFLLSFAGRILFWYTQTTMFKPVDPKPDFPKLEEKILRFWEKNKILPKYLEKNKASKKRFSFLDGPITANNPMGVHHAWGRTLKDLYQRYKNMQGFKERFQNGFDNQGLWVEVEVEKKLGFKSKKDIEKYGIAKFVEECKKHTLHFAKIQTEQSKRLGYFMDWGNDYYTMSDENNYAIWHFLKKVWQDGNLYKGRDSVPWCPRCGTAISQHEILTEEYQELTHESIYFNLPVEGCEDEYFLVWTTTPWTLPANVALAVNPELEYWLVRGITGIRFWIVGSLAKKVFDDKGSVVKKVSGKELVGLKYRGPFDELEAVQEAKKENPGTFHSVVASKDLVNEEEGTGIVHIATGCGTEDFRLGKEKNLSVLPAIDEAANYLEGFGDLTGRNAKDDPSLVLGHPLLKDYIEDLQSFTHRYPVCWRCKTELVWRVVDEWYIAMDAARHQDAKNYRQRLQEVIKDVRWIPSFGYDRELDWLRNMEDWLISKKRYWGLCLPIWECECGHFEVIGSKEELRERAVEGWEEFEGHTPHRPWADAIRVKCSKCDKLANRIPDVGNPWLDAGIVSFSTLKYFEDKDHWQEWFPADLVLESFPGQFKNWFYSLLAMSVVLEDRTPFKTLVGYALVRDEHGEEMHKSKGNAIEFNDAAERIGADVMRWMYTRHNITRNLNFGYGPAEEIKRRFLLILWNCYKFFIGYANIDEWIPKERKSLSSKHILDRWVLSRLNQLVKTATDSLNNYDAFSATRAIEDFVVNDLSTWYIRRSRGRIGPTSQSSYELKEDCYATLAEVLLTLNKLLAPFLPFLTEEMYQNLAYVKGGSASTSVHLEDWPEVDESLIDESLEEEMNRAREIVEKAHAQRKDHGRKVRQPLRMWLSGKIAESFSPDVLKVIGEELNVKIIVGKPPHFEDVEIDPEITPDLKVRGEVRELIRNIQNLRKEAGCELSDEITVEAPSWPKEFEKEIKQKTLATELKIGSELKIIK